MRVNGGYAVGAIGYVAGISLLSALPQEWGGGFGVAVLNSTPVLTALHVLLFAGLVSCVILCLTDGQWERKLQWPVYLLIGAAAGLFAAFHEWHASAATDADTALLQFGLNCTGIVTLLLVHGAVRRGGTR